jgi:hypothetical protein
VILAGFVPTRRSQGTLAIKAGGSRSRRFQRREAGGHGGAVARAQRVAINFDGEAIRNLLALRSHIVDVFGLEVSSSNWVERFT